MKANVSKRVLAMLLCGAMAASLTACGGSSNGGSTSTGGDAASTSGDVIELQIGFENSISEPIGQGIEKWAELLEEASGGTMTITAYPDSQLGSKNELIDSMMLGEPFARWRTARSMQITVYRISASCSGRSCSTAGMSAGR